MKDKVMKMAIKLDDLEVKREFLEANKIKDENVLASEYLKLAAERGKQILEMEKEIKELKEIYITVLQMSRVGPL